MNVELMRLEWVLRFMKWEHACDMFAELQSCEYMEMAARSNAECRIQRRGCWLLHTHPVV
jgi:hypothetical protein